MKVIKEVLSNISYKSQILLFFNPGLVSLLSSAGLCSRGSYSGFSSAAN